MSTQIALLRAVNVGGTGKVPMAQLRAVIEGLGFCDVRTLLQSGNVVFGAGTRKPASVEPTLEAAVAKAFGVATDIHVRTAAELAAVAAANPFPTEAQSDPARLHVLFLRKAPPKAAFATLQAAIVGKERVRGDGRHAYIHFPDGAGASKLTPAMLARHLGAGGTARNWNTVRKLIDLSS